jgi:phosphoribosylformylglycinamidine synthase
MSTNLNFKAIVTVKLRTAILDVQGKTVENALNSMGYGSISHIRIGKHITLDVVAKNKEEAENIVKKAADQLLSNTIVEDYIVEIE